jgi:phosphatidylserine/phosphatidylglycerophosphate/cardiolipin synthase-like enzyme
MKRCVLLFIVLTITLWVALSSCATVPTETTSPLTWEVYFSPNGGCTDVIVRELDKAQSAVLVQAYSFTSYKIAMALLNAHKRGVKVEIILDKSQKSDQYSSADFLKGGVKVRQVAEENCDT